MSDVGARSLVPVDPDRVRGAFLGLAVGDAVGTTVEFRRPGSFPPLTDLVGGGPFRLPPGAWTDDTSMTRTAAARASCTRAAAVRTEPSGHGTNGW